MSSINNLFSNLSPSSNGMETAASMHRMLFSGAIKPLVFRAIIFLTLLKISGLSIASCNRSLVSLSLGWEPLKEAFSIA